MTPQRLYQTGIRPALDELAALDITATPQAGRFLLAIAIQESGLRARRQIVTGGAENGPAASFWQGEVTGGMCLTLKHATVGPRMKAICDAYNVQPTALALWEAMRYNDIVAACAARLLVYTLPGALPIDQESGWNQYLAAWRPGKPDKARWADSWKTATETVGC